MWKWKAKRLRYKYQFVNEIPQLLHTNTLYVEGNQKHRWTAAFICPCGCNEIIYLNLIPTTRPRWKIKLGWFKKPTVSPSINRRIECKSHFFIKKGRIKWV
ncbi:DUF6527 family protein [Prolixibacter denitrificans]|uniref:DUF6527 family protein n=1 Tax=Prolixibacter denitrificans TaxID=1541063 RepID=UPI000D0DEE8B